MPRGQARPWTRREPCVTNFAPKSHSPGRRVAARDVKVRLQSRAPVQWLACSGWPAEDCIAVLENKGSLHALARGAG